MRWEALRLPHQVCLHPEALMMSVCLPASMQTACLDIQLDGVIALMVVNDLILLQLYACQSYPQFPSVAMIRAVWHEHLQEHYSRTSIC